MNINKMRAASIKNTMQMKAAMNGEGQHHDHINDYCDYADAAAEAAAYDVRRDLPDAVQKEVAKQVGKRQVGIEIDKQSFAKAKAAIKDVFDSIARLGK